MAEPSYTGFLSNSQLTKFFRNVNDRRNRRNKARFKVVGSALDWESDHVNLGSISLGLGVLCSLSPCSSQGACPTGPELLRTSVSGHRRE